MKYWIRQVDGDTRQDISWPDDEAAETWLKDVAISYQHCHHLSPSWIIGIHLKSGRYIYYNSTNGRVEEGSSMISFEEEPLWR